MQRVQTMQLHSVVLIGHQHVSIMQGKESELTLQTVCQHHSLLFIKFLIIEGAAMVHVTQVELEHAQRDLTVLLELCTDHPALLGKPLLSSLYMLVGQCRSANICPKTSSRSKCQMQVPTHF